MADPVWKVSRCEYDIEETGGQVKVTNLHYQVSYMDGEFIASSYGSTGDNQNRVYALPALQAVPMSVMVKWVKQSLGDEEVASIEQSLLDNIVEQKTPTSGGITPAEG